MRAFKTCSSTCMVWLAVCVVSPAAAQESPSSDGEDKIERWAFPATSGGGVVVVSHIFELSFQHAE